MNKNIFLFEEEDTNQDPLAGEEEVEEDEDGKDEEEEEEEGFGNDSNEDYQ